MPRKPKYLRTCLCAGLALGLCAPAAAQDTGDASATVLNRVNVIGDPAEIYTIPGSAHFISSEQIREQSYDDINRVLRHVPGVYLREEDGHGLFPNISLRGVDTSRSAKVTLMEDGVLAAPAPYAAPAAYYSPTTGRMSGLEVLKGTSQVRYGPHTTGGAINYISTPIPGRERTFIRAQYGENNEIRNHAFHGNTVDTDFGRVGYLAEIYYRETDGFKRIDPALDFNDIGRTGFHNIEPMLKVSWEPDAGTFQRFELKYGHTDKKADETYLGLTTADLREDPFRRYSSSRFDNIDTEHDRFHVRHFLSPTDSFDLVTTAYYNKFFRNWYKLNGISAGDISGALAGGPGLACLRGNEACTLQVRANRREYTAWGLQSEGTSYFETGAASHELTVGVRYHEDEEDRFQEEDDYSQAANGAITGVMRGIPGSQANRVDSAEALAVFVQDRIEHGDWWFTPGIRYESIDYARNDRTSGTRRGESLDVWGGGIGAGYQLNEEWQAFAGIHLGFSPPGPGGAIGDNLKEETTVGYELGTRYARSDGAAAAEVVGFLTRFEDLIVTPNFGATGSSETENLGEVDAYGVEVSAQFDAGAGNDWSFSNPYFLAFTYTSAEIQSDTGEASAGSIFSFGRQGNKVPYIPEYQLTAGASFNFARWGTSLTASYVDDTFTSANNVSAELDGEGNPDARFGKTDSYTVVDVSAHYNLNRSARLFGGVHNLLEEEYIVSRQPLGPRPGRDRTWFVGVEIDM